MRLMINKSVSKRTGIEGEGELWVIVQQGEVNGRQCSMLSVEWSLHILCGCTTIPGKPLVARPRVQYHGIWPVHFMATVHGVLNQCIYNLYYRCELMH